MKPVRVRLKDRSYSIRFGSYNKEFPRFFKQVMGKPSRVFVVTSRALVKCGYLKTLVRAIGSTRAATVFHVVSDGEAHKTLATVTGLYRQGLKKGLDRKSAVVALGGGVITDMTGFFAATYMRGVPYVSIPTTLLGMVDAAIGGKTGVDLPEGKNLVGAFWQPRLVWMDPSLLKTLPEKEWINGFAEVIKYGVIRSRPFFEWLEAKIRERPRLVKWPLTDVQHAIYQSAQIKADVVSRDEQETPLKGQREILNFGHTVGHALEAATGYKTLSHGQAISIGMVVAGRLARSFGLWSGDAQLRLILMLQAVGLPIHFPRLSGPQKEKFWPALLKDKKHISGKLRFVLPKRIGVVETRSGVPISLVKKTLAELEKPSFPRKRVPDKDIRE